MSMYIGEPFSWKPAAFQGSAGILSVTTKETTAHRRVVYINVVWGRHTGLAICIASEIADIPAADVAPVVHARWIPFHSETAGDIQYCSNCKIGNAAKSDFCPHCGAKMDGGDSDAVDRW